ncbi:MAG: anti-virulence regulator CigR family protein [Acetobacteraceae bacterium]|nr:anti-virulence regulator CigR family protein [Acetobacteraceae bacterium]
MRGWYAANPGVHARPLPPGVVRQLARGRPLPPGIARPVAPPGLLAILPRYPGHTWYVIGTAVVLVEAAAGILRDLLLDALLR